MAIDVGTAIGYLDLDTSGFERGFKTALNDLKVFQDKSASFGDQMTALGSSLTSAGKSLTTGVTLPLVGVGTVAVKTASDFDSAMAEVKAISSATGDDFEALRNKAKEMGAKTKFSASEAAEAMKYMAMAGWKTTDMLEGIEGIMNLAAASGENLGSVSDIVTDALTAFGLQAKDSAHFSDVLAAASNNANTNVSMLGESFKYVAPVAGSLGFSVEDTSVALGLMANSGIKASQAGTALRTLLTNMVKPTDAMEAAMDKLNLSITDSGGNMKSLSQIMVDLRSGFSNLSEAQQASVAAALAGKEGMSGLLAIVNTGEEDFNKLTEAINSADGTAQTMSDTMLNNLGGQLTILKSTLEGIAISFGDILMPAIQKITEKLQEFANWLNNLDEDQKEAIVKIATVVASIGPLLLILGKLITSVSKIATLVQAVPQVISTVSGVFKGLGAAIGGVSAPILGVVAAIGVLIAAFKHLWDVNEEFRTSMTGIWDGIKEKFSEFGQSIVETINSLGFDFENFTEVLSSLWDGFCSLLAPIFEGVFENISNILGVVLDTISGVFKFWVAIFKGDWEGAWDAVKETFSSIWEGIKNAFTIILDTLKGILDSFLGLFGTSWDELWTKVKNFFIDTWESMKTGITNAVKTIGDKISKFASDIVNWFKELPSKLLDIGKNLVNGLWDGIKSAGSWLKEKITGFANGIISDFKETFGIASPSKVMKSQGGFLMQGLAQGMKSSLGVVKSEIGVVADTINDTLDDIFGTARVLNVSADMDSDSFEPVTNSVKHRDSRTPMVQNQYSFTYNSPKAVTPTVAAKLLKQTAQQLSLGFN